MPAGTHVFSPSSTQASPSRRAVVVGASGSWLAGSTSAAVSTVSPDATPGSSALRCSAVPNCAIGSAPSTTASRNGTGATVRPTCSSTIAASRNP